MLFYNSIFAVLESRLMEQILEQIIQLDRTMYMSTMETVINDKGIIKINQNQIPNEFLYCCQIIIL